MSDNKRKTQTFDFDYINMNVLHYIVNIQESYLISLLMSKKPNIHLKNNKGKLAI
ncbi:hypothetical protein H8356DRAFT_1334254 [Neocallimastix lanati (nom. inval.)]|nr:hypothetical protein H8356DRAFT_1334254 [Neocallimastix sp. JGI-2020a]